MKRTFATQESQEERTATKTQFFCYWSTMLLLAEFLLLTTCFIRVSSVSIGLSPTKFTLTLVQLVEAKSKAKRSVQEVIETDTNLRSLSIVSDQNMHLIVGEYPGIVTTARINLKNYGKLNYIKLTDPIRTTFH